jgi:CBS-domain-containing membrane protein
MQTTTKSLFALTAADLMSQTVVTIPQAMSLRGAAHLLSQFHITGAPVVDAEGRCVGVLSASDFLSWAEKDKPVPKHHRDNGGCAHSAWQIMGAETFPDEDVRRYMTADPVMTGPATPVGTLARMMVDAHIHRVIVVDERYRPIGIVSSTDILAVVAQAAKRRLVEAEA